jgi:hypothetical protein
MTNNDFEDEIRDKLAKDGCRYTPVSGLREFYIKHYMQIPS